MADFCLECTLNIFSELLPTGENDLAGLCEPGEITWRKLAKTCAQYLAKGRQVMVIGRVVASAYVGQDGTPRASMEVTADQVRFLGDKNAANGNAAPHGDPDTAHIDENDEVPF